MGPFQGKFMCSEAVKKVGEGSNVVGYPSGIQSVVRRDLY
jgi:hypothetical protein